MAPRWIQKRKKRLRIERTCRRLKSDDDDLTEIDWDDEEVTDSDLTKLAKVLSRNTNLTELHLCENDVSKVGASELMYSLRNNTGVKELWLSANNICDDGAASVSGLLRFNTTLRWLNLNENNITSQGATYIASGLRKNETMEYLWLNGNRICDAGAKSLAKALGSNETLQLFSLAENRVGEAGADALASTLRTNDSLGVLGLYGNFLGDGGAESIASALSDNSSLTELYLGKNGITSRGAVAFASALQAGNTTLLKLWLAQNRVDDEGAMALAYALTANATLQEINLGRNDITKRGARALADSLRTNTVLATTGLGGGNHDDGEGTNDSAELAQDGHNGRPRFSNNSAASRIMARMSYGSSSRGLSYNSLVSHDDGAAVSYESERRIDKTESDQYEHTQHVHQMNDGAVVQADFQNGDQDVKMGTEARWEHRGSDEDPYKNEVGNDSIDMGEPIRTMGVGIEPPPCPTSSFTSKLVREGEAEAAISRRRIDAVDTDEKQTNGEEIIRNGTRYPKENQKRNITKQYLDSSQQHQQWDRAKEGENIGELSKGMADMQLKQDVYNRKMVAARRSDNRAVKGT
mmetsp:Transcript_51352/g.154293  ORF Transcript_51352/g.154293 Transcript_51352/m.154293 type:complete len:580 (-) Transcript_51352:520-2259(-)|eukprot:CAMPEP_0113533316 /NCGR_PEP_ID=MMETSP0015_2-20120614/4533_1 /TAXON_ID=2838 /ORGANISM="Odontella" /LENGTH=579 /DNA_ID=CAMNT_0000432347 /DNA_START=96 /DNA_END=1835 /DNA_ORIENTATION=+ /assembly_acc=CAM_ASM_000160